MIAPRSPGLFLFLILAVPVVAQDPPPPTFDLLPAFGVGMKTEDIAIADYDGDGELDAAMGNTYFNLSPELGSFSVIFNEGDGTFTQMVGIEQFVGFRTEGLTAGDFNGDGYADLAAANFNIASSNVVILLSDGPSRTFTEIQTIPLSTGGVLHPPRHIRAGHWNLDEDNFLDLATANHDNDTVSLLTGNGDGTFSLLEPFIAVGDGPETVSVANLNGDSDIDILITNAESNTMTVLLGTAGANFSVAASFPSGGSRPRFASAFDFDGDGLDDFVVSHWENPGETLVYRNLGAGTAFSVEASLAIPGSNTSPIHPTIGDLNNDGIPDIIVSYYREDSIVLYPGLPTGSFDFGAAQTFAAGDGPYGTVIMNFDASSGDTRNDLILTNTRDHEVWIFLGMQVGDNPPDAVVDVFTIEEDSAASILDVLANDSDPDAGDTLTITNVTSPSMGGAVSIVSAGTELSYTPPAATTGDETFDYTIEDSQGNTDTATVTVTIFATAPNQPPLAVNDAFGVTVGTNDNTLLVLTNDSDPDVGDTLTITSVGPTSAGGTATIASGSTSVLYSPGSGFSGDETFDYTIEDPDGASATATVTVTVGEQLAFLQDNGSQGFLVVEAENYHEHTPRSGYDWLFGTTPADFGGTGTMTVLPEDFQSFSSNYAANAPELKFYFQAAHSGTHYVWARGHGPNSGSNSLHVGLDGAEVPSAAAVPIPTGGGYSWSNDVRTLEVPAPGLYCLNVWGRETGTVVDRLVLTIDPAFTPSGMGPAESPQQGQNLPPIAVADNATVDEDSTANVIQVLTNDSDPELDPFTIIAVSNPTNGTASIVNGDTEVAYTPFADFGGADSFTYTISDGNGTATATVSVTVTGLPDSPTAADDLTFSVAENSGANSLNVLANDSDPDVGDTLTIVNVTATLLGGTATITGGGATLAYTPPADTTGVDSFDYTIEDSTGNPATATVNVTITAGPPNQPPTAVDDSFSVAHNSVDNALDALANDFDPDVGDTLTIVSVGPTSVGGNVVIVGGGTQLQYTSVTGFSGVETFDYTIQDPDATTDVATVTVTVAPSGPAAFIQSGAADGLLVMEAENYHATISRSGVDWLPTTSPSGFVGAGAMHTQPDGASFPSNYATTAPELKYYFQAAHAGTHYVWIRGYGPDGGANSVHVGLDDQEVPSASAIPVTKRAGYVWSSGLHTVEVPGPGLHCLNVWARERETVLDRIVLTIDDLFSPDFDGPVESPQVGQNLPPVAVADSFTVAEDSTGNVLTVLTNDSDPEDDPLSLTAVGGASKGTPSISGDTILYTPFANASGADSFTYTISAEGGTADATVSVTISDVPDPPVAVNDNYGVEENSPATTLPVLVNDSDPDVGDTLTIVNVTATLLGGTATITGGGATLAYTPPADTFGVDSFDYTIEDAAGNPATATVVVTITLGPPNVPPVAIDDAFAVLEGSVGSTLDVLGNDDDPDGTTLVITFVGGPDQGGTASSINGGTAISYTPAGGFTGEETFDYMIEDASAASALATVTVTVVPGGTGVFLMSSGPDGLLVIEAEDFHRETNSSDGDDAGWELVANPPADVQGDAVHILPDVSGPWPTDYALAAPELEFDFIATQTGTFFVWVLGQADNGGKNSVHVGIDGLEAVTAQKIEFDKDDPDWNWNTNLHTVEVDAPGPHTLNLWGRERATKVDRLLLTRDPDFVPAGSGPSASPTDQNPPTATTRVIQISVSGLHADAVATLGASLAPNLFRLRTEGAFTDAARADPDSTATVPNHASLLTGRFVLGASGHGWVTDAVSCGGGAPSNVHGGGYVDSAFDVAHDNGLSTAFYASRDELCLVEQSWDGANGAPDTTGSDDGTDKIDHVFRANSDDDTVVTQFVAALQSSHHDLSVVQLGGPEVVGHASGFDLSVGSSYLGAVESLDARLGDILDTIDADPNLVGNTFVILTAEHGGALLTSDHLDPGLLDNAAVPFYVWGPGVLAGADLYAANGGFRLDPGATVPPALTTPPPIRGADAPNLALDLLGLPAVPGSTINAAQDLLVP